MKLVQLHLAEVQIRKHKDDTKPTKNYTCSYTNGNWKHHLGTGFLTYNGTVKKEALHHTV